MCLIITQPAGDALTHAEVRDVYARNPHGFGVMSDEGTLRALPRDAQHACDLYDEHAAGRACVAHWRYSTHGTVSRANVHPFDVAPGLAVVHNGVIPGYGRGDVSDTREFVAAFLRPNMAQDAAGKLASPEFRAWLARYLGRSVLVFRDASGVVTIVDGRTPANVGARSDNRPVVVAGRWYSNTYAWSAHASLRMPVYSTRAVEVALDSVLPGTRPAPAATARPAGTPSVHPVNPFARVTPRAPLAFVCPLCGQRIDDGKPCGCGARGAHASTVGGAA